MTLVGLSEPDSGNIGSVGICTPSAPGLELLTTAADGVNDGEGDKPFAPPLAWLLSPELPGREPAVLLINGVVLGVRPWLDTEGWLAFPAGTSPAPSDGGLAVPEPTSP